jgi:hypothetical protein
MSLETEDTDIHASRKNALEVFWRYNGSYQHNLMKPLSTPSLHNLLNFESDILVGKLKSF